MTLNSLTEVHIEGTDTMMDRLEDAPEICCKQKYLSVKGGNICSKGQCFMFQPNCCLTLSTLGEHAFALVTFPFEVNSQVWFADCLLYLTPCIHITEFIWNWTFQTWCHLLEKTLTFCLWHEHYPFCWWLFIGFATEDCLVIKNSRRFCWYFIDMYIT